ncbi:hypothetical protein JTE90_008478 [Oedothorax gibbosus]|uniref:Amiloride-sensitive sodium channel n=1 Tax=Oedothorax gibbosus TaxID=931172 RepID=A0AAV6UZ62_9ARAC|nr:hypothetical protein JTE90_008478 [Oedothorax gibbosus]
MTRRFKLTNFRSNSDMQDLYDQKQDGRTDKLSFWRCGHQKKRSEVVANFAKSSSVHGAAYVFSPSERRVSKCGKFGYRVLFVFCVLSVISHIGYLLYDNFGKESTVINTINRDMESGYEGDPHFPIYPRITICRRPFYRTDVNATYLQLVEYAMLSLGLPFTPLTPTEVASLVRLAIHDLGWVKEELPSMATDLGERLNNLEDKYGRLKKSEGYNLRSFVEEHSIKFIYGNWANSNSTAHEGSEVGFRVYLSDPSIEAPAQLEQFDGQNVMPGCVTTLKAALIKTERVNLHTPLHGMWNTCPTWGRTDNGSSDRYSYDVCDQENYFEWVRRICGCELLLHTAGSQTSRLCDPIDLYQCSIRASFTNHSELLSTCKQPCTTYSYKTETSYMGMGRGSNISRIEIMYNSNHYTLNEYRKVTLSFLFSQIGGSLGLYLGASIITLVEIAGFVASWLWYRLAPAKVANTCAKVKPQFYKGRLQGNFKTELVNY